MVEAQDESIWFGTRLGVSRHDGYRWEFTILRDPEVGAPVFRLLRAPDDSIYTATPKGISRRLSGPPALASLRSGSERGRQHLDGSIWAATAHRALRIHAHGALRIQEQSATLLTMAYVAERLRPLAPELNDSIIPDDMGQSRG